MQTASDLNQCCHCKSQDDCQYQFWTGHKT